MDLSDPEEFTEILRDFFCDVRHAADAVGIDQDGVTGWFLTTREGYQEEVDDENAVDDNESEEQS